jgi:hypothetical protein
MITVAVGRERDQPLAQQRAALLVQGGDDAVAEVGPLGDLVEDLLVEHVVAERLAETPGHFLAQGSGQS